MDVMLCYILVFFFNDTATTEIYTLSLHDALPISMFFDLTIQPLPTKTSGLLNAPFVVPAMRKKSSAYANLDRKSTRLNSSHANISYAVFCLKKKKTQPTNY